MSDDPHPGGHRKVGAMRIVSEDEMKYWHFPEDHKKFIWEELDKQIKEHVKLKGYQWITPISHHEVPNTVPDFLDEASGNEIPTVIFHATAVVRPRP